MKTLSLLTEEEIPDSVALRAAAISGLRSFPSYTEVVLQDHEKVLKVVTTGDENRRTIHVMEKV